MLKKYYGTFEELQNHVKSTRIQGEWQSDGNKHVFRSLEGGIINWWSSKGTINVQGKPDEQAYLERMVLKALPAKQNRLEPGKFTQDGSAHDNLPQSQLNFPEVSCLSIGFEF